MVPFPMSRRPNIAVTRAARVFGPRWGRRNVGDDLGRDCRSGTEQQDSVGKTHSSQQHNTREVHGQFHSVYDMNESYPFRIVCQNGIKSNGPGFWAPRLLGDGSYFALARTRAPAK